MNMECPIRGAINALITKAEWGNLFDVGDARQLVQQNCSLWTPETSGGAEPAATSLGGASHLD